MPNSPLQYYGCVSIAESTVTVDGNSYTLVETNLPYQMVTNLSATNALVQSQGGSPTYSFTVDLSTGFIFNANPVAYLGEGTASQGGTLTQGLEDSTNIPLPNDTLTQITGFHWPWVQPIAYRGKRDSAVLLSNFQAFQRLFAQYTQILRALTISTSGFLVSDEVAAQIGYARNITNFQNLLRRKDPLFIGWY